MCCTGRGREAIGALPSNPCDGSSVSALLAASAVPGHAKAGPASLPGRETSRPGSVKRAPLRAYGAAGGWSSGVPSPITRPVAADDTTVTVPEPVSGGVTVLSVTVYVAVPSESPAITAE